MIRESCFSERQSNRRLTLSKISFLVAPWNTQIAYLCPLLKNNHHFGRLIIFKMKRLFINVILWLHILINDFIHNQSLVVAEEFANPSP